MMFEMEKEYEGKVGHLKQAFEYIGSRLIKTL